jgi:hypothetical protein
MDSQQNEFKMQLKVLRTIHSAMFFGQAIFAAITLYLVMGGLMEENAPELSSIFLYIVPVFVAGGLISSQILFKSRLSSAKKESTLMKKIASFRGALIIKYALLEGPCLFALIVYLVTGNLIFMGLAAIIILYFVSLVPTASKIAFYLELSGDEKSSLSIH